LSSPLMELSSICQNHDVLTVAAGGTGVAEKTAYIYHTF
jgi:hypothetical protein